MARVDIIMGIYNCEDYLCESIDSILEQTFNGWRLIICDDKSTDKSLEIVEDYARRYPKKIIVLRNNKNMGLNYTLNKCLKETSADYIARQDGDDLSVATRLEKEVSFLDNHKEYAMVSSNMILFDERGVWGKTQRAEKPKKEDFINGTPFCHAPCMIRREVIMELGGYSEDVSTIRVEDYDLWFRMYLDGYVGYNFQKCLYKMRDDKSAAKRRTIRNRINEFKLKKRIYKAFDILFMSVYRESCE